MPKPQIVDITVQLLAKTEKAICVTEGDLKDKVWLPLSQIEYEVERDDIVVVSLPRWLAVDKKFAGY